jgi:hypothetical protein
MRCTYCATTLVNPEYRPGKSYCCIWSAHCATGLSYAQLREAYIIAGQRAFIAQREISLDDLLEGTETLRGTTVAGSRHSRAPGF